MIECFILDIYLQQRRMDQVLDLFLALLTTSQSCRRLSLSGSLIDKVLPVRYVLGEDILHCSKVRMSGGQIAVLFCAPISLPCLAAERK